jgi:RNA polymerase sigma-70 factor, ECF subfamily
MPVPRPWRASVSQQPVLSAELLDRLPEVRQKLTVAVRRTCPPWLAAQAEDLVQAAMVKIVDLAARSAEPQEITAAYLWRVAYCAVVDEIRRQRRRREVPLLGEADGAVEPPAATPGPERRAGSSAIGRAIVECLARLLPGRRQAVTLHLLGHTVSETARLLGWSGKRADNNVYRGLSDLRGCLAGKGVTP